MTTGVNLICFTASYAIALALELTALWRPFRGHRLAVGAATVAGIVAHTWYLGLRAIRMPEAPLSSPHDWYQLAAWALAVVYVGAAAYYPGRSIGLFVLPTMLGLIAVGSGASLATLGRLDAPRIWGRLHALFLVLGTVAVLLGFVAGLMYLVQSWRLKHKAPADSRFRLPSLEWLERVNSRALGAAVLFVGLGFVTGVLVTLARNAGGVPWSDPVVASLAGMLLWLLVAEGFRLVYPAARRGRKVAYLTVAAFGFLALVLAMFSRPDSIHEPPAPAPESPTAQQNANERGGSP